MSESVNYLEEKNSPRSRTCVVIAAVLLIGTLLALFGPWISKAGAASSAVRNQCDSVAFQVNREGEWVYRQGLPATPWISLFGNSPTVYKLNWKVVKGDAFREGSITLLPENFRRLLPNRRLARLLQAGSDLELWVAPVKGHKPPKIQVCYQRKQ